MTRKFFKPRLLSLLAAAFCMVGAFSVQAQDNNNTVLPELPDPIQNLANEGAQIRFLGKDYGLEGWIAIKNGKEQYFYVLPDNGGFLTGLLFDENGQAVTVEQVNRLRKQNDGELLDQLTSDRPQKTVKNSQKAEKYEFKKPSEQLFWDIENSNWIPVGKAGTPVIYSFVDPQCPYCHDMMMTMRDEIEAGKVQVRLIPVGFKEETKAQAAYLLATPAPEEVWWRHMDGDESALPAKREISQQGVERNLAIMQSWKLSVTPLIVYRAKDNSVKIIRGKPKNLNSLINDIGSRT